jgi:uncharacterized protein (DUF4415 family)
MKTQQNEKTTRAIIKNGQVMIEQSDGSYLPAEKDKTNFARLDAMQDADIDYSEIPELTEEFFKAASVPLPPKKEQLTIRIDGDVLEFLKQEQGYHTRINMVLRAYMQHQKNDSHDLRQ